MKILTRRILHGLFFILTIPATLAALFYAVENWRGARAWAAVRRDLQAHGESLDPRDLIPPPVPDDQNLAMAPLFTQAFRYAVDPHTGLLTFSPASDWYNSSAYKQMQDLPWGRDKVGLHVPAGYGSWMTGHATDLSVLQEYYRRRPEFPHPDQPGAPADDVLLALTRFTPLLNALAQAAAERPQTRFPVNWTQRPSWGISLPHYNTIRVLVTTLRLRAAAELALGQTAAARSDMDLMFRLRQSMAKDPSLIAALVDITCLGIWMQPVWEGLAARQWSAADLDALRGELLGINVLRGYQQGMRGELVFFTASLREELQDTAQARELSRDLPVVSDPGTFPSSPFLKRWLWWLLPYWPRGWFAQNAALQSRYLKDYWIDTVDPANHRVALARIKDIDRVLKNIPFGPTTYLVQVALPGFTDVARKFAQAQAIVDQAATACALEMYYLDHHDYPAALAALVPGYLDRVPTDVIDGAPMRYRRTIDGRYQLWSIGWDGRDNGGTIAWPPDRRLRQGAGGTATFPEPLFSSPSKDAGDWVWQYAPAEPPDPPVNTTRLESLP